MRNRLIALALLAVAIAALAWVFAGRDGPAQPQAVPMTSLAPATVTRLVVKKLNKTAYVLQRRNERWHLLKPQDRPAAAQVVHQLLAALGETTARSYPAASLDLSQAGLDPPAWTLIANGVRLDFGTLNPTTLLRYVHRGDTVYLVMDHIAPLIARGPAVFLPPPPASAPHARTAGS